ncbi:MAG: F0F1 ATP synthase subunit B [Rhodospirillaceae bacterium]|jgi:F-type H+-transporting ATPase subunit b|nr:F0F1 ATP synthase subunit B [Rhodospirillaceae bacterium]MBT5666471.1 F0F1 ATP synthase subunit B [Rhodospirillaceae bacterium]MBT5811615.1 F0F1 ATP synthase subunit B [Rhodospirillaceae bacterium]
MAFLHDPTFAVLIAFIIFVALLFKPIKNALGANLDAKIAQIRNEVDEAQRLREEAQAMLASYQRQQRDAVQEVEALVARAQSDAAAHAAEAARALDAALKRQEQQAQEKIAQAEATALREIRDQAVDVAIAATTRLLTDKLSGDAGDTLIDQSIRDLPERLH